MKKLVYLATALLLVVALLSLSLWPACADESSWSKRTWGAQQGDALLVVKPVPATLQAELRGFLRIVFADDAPPDLDSWTLMLVAIDNRKGSKPVSWSQSLNRVTVVWRAPGKEDSSQVTSEDIHLDISLALIDKPANVQRGGELLAITFSDLEVMPEVMGRRTLAFKTSQQVKAEWIRAVYMDSGFKKVKLGPVEVVPR